VTLASILVPGLLLGLFLLGLMLLAAKIAAMGEIPGHFRKKENEDTQAQVPGTREAPEQTCGASRPGAGLDVDLPRLEMQAL